MIHPRCLLSSNHRTMCKPETDLVTVMISGNARHPYQGIHPSWICVQTV